jgi:hypothetical protein
MDSRRWGHRLRPLSEPLSEPLQTGESTLLKQTRQDFAKLNDLGLREMVNQMSPNPIEMIG